MSLVAGMLIGANLGVLAAMAVQAAARRSRPCPVPVRVQRTRVTVPAGPAACLDGVAPGRVPGPALRALPGALDGSVPSKVSRRGRAPR